MGYNSRIGSHFVGIIFSDGDKTRMIQDAWLRDAEIDDESKLVVLRYPGCGVIEISGYNLRKIFDDATIGALGTVTRDGRAKDTGGLAVTHIKFKEDE